MHHKQQDRIVATMYSLGTWFVSGICVWIPYIKETMMNIIIIIIIIIITYVSEVSKDDGYSVTWWVMIYCLCHSWLCYHRRLERRKQYTSVFVKRLRKR